MLVKGATDHDIHMSDSELHAKFIEPRLWGNAVNWKESVASFWLHICVNFTQFLKNFTQTWYTGSKKFRNMMTSSSGNTFRVTGPLCGELQRPVTLSFDVFFDLRLHKRLSKQSSGWWFETPSWSLWRHRNDELCSRFYGYSITYTAQLIHTVCALLCFVVVWFELPLPISFRVTSHGTVLNILHQYTKSDTVTQSGTETNKTVCIYICEDILYNESHIYAPDTISKIMYQEWNEIGIFPRGTIIIVRFFCLLSNRFVNKTAHKHRVFQIMDYLIWIFLRYQIANCVNSLGPKDTYIRRWTCQHCFGAKPLYEPNVGILLIGPLGKKSMRSKFMHFHSRKCIWKCHPKNGSHLVSASIS